MLSGVLHVCCSFFVMLRIVAPQRGCKQQIGGHQECNKDEGDFEDEEITTNGFLDSMITTATKRCEGSSLTQRTKSKDVIQTFLFSCNCAATIIHSVVDGETCSFFVTRRDFRFNSALWETNIVSLLARNCWNGVAIHTTDEWSILILPVCHKGSRGAMYAKSCITVPSSETVCCFRCSPGIFTACCLRLLEFGAGLSCVCQAGNRAAVGARPSAKRAIQRPGVLPGFLPRQKQQKKHLHPSKIAQTCSPPVANAQDRW